MKRIFTFVLLALLVVAFTTARAQQNIYVWKDGGQLSVKSVTEVDSLTLSGDWFYHITTSEATSVTANALKASANVAFVSGEPLSLSLTPEVGVCFSSVSANPTYADEHVCLGVTIENYNFALYDLDAGTTYYYCVYVKLGDELFYGNVQSATTMGKKPSSPNYTLINGHKFIDLGLPSGLLWALTNVGATFSSDNGDYYAWGEIEAKSSCYDQGYKWIDDNKTENRITKYNKIDGKTTLDAEDDVATVKWGVNCRMPTKTDFEELQNECNWAWQESYQGTSGYLVIGKNGNTIFLPAAGTFAEISFRGTGYYWTSSLYDFIEDEISYSWFFYLYHGEEDYYGLPLMGNLRSSGNSVRPVAEKP